MGDLLGLAFAAVRRAPDDPAIAVNDGVAAAPDGPVSGQVDGLGAVPEIAELVGCQEAGAGKGGFSAKDAVELDGVPAALVDLEGDLAAVEDDGCDAGRAGLGGQEGARFFGN